ncbi:MAG: hypothetical protein J0I63_15390 [Thiobacillus sp.]|nr:hypothetical protein [Thiobacillus sp.]
MTFFLNHELGATSGVARAHGATGAFVSQWTMHLNSKQIMAGEDLITQVKDWDNFNKQFVDTTGATQFGRFCSADLPAKTAFHNPTTGRGFDGLIFMKGEEAGNEGRAYATIVSGDEKGTSYQLPSLGRSTTPALARSISMSATSSVPAIRSSRRDCKTASSTASGSITEGMVMATVW